MEFMDSTKTRDYISLLLSLDSTANKCNANTVRKYIDELKISFAEKNLMTKSIAKQAKEVYKTVHQDKLKKYEYLTFFPEIFKNGNFNCATASALYSLVLEELKIPYEIKEMPTHVYIMVAPKSDNILFETTTPESGFLTYNDKFISSYIEHLKNNKIISQEDINIHTSNELFNKYFFGENQTITLTQLCGLQYYNLGISAIDSKEYLKAIRALEKAELLYPSQRNKFLITSIVPDLLNENLSPDMQGKYMGKMSLYSKSPTTTMYIEEKFKEISHQLVINKPQISSYALFCKSFFCYLKDTSLYNTLSFAQHALLCDYYHAKSNYTQCLKELELAYHYNAENIYLRNSIKEVVGRKFYGQYEEKIEIDTLEWYVHAFGFLKNEEVFHDIYTHVFMIRIRDYLEANQKETAEKYLQIFLKSIERFQCEKPEHRDDMIGSVYGEMCAYYFRKNQFDKSKKWAIDGLKLAPKSGELKRKLEIAESMHYINVPHSPTKSTKPPAPKHGTAIAY